MRGIAVSAAVLMGLVAAPVGAQTAPDSGADGLGHCMVLKTTGEDRIVLSRWIVGALASAPAVGGVTKVDPVGMDKANHDFATLFTRLLTVDCFDAAHAVSKSSGQAGFGSAFKALAEIAIGEVTRDPAASAALGGFAQYIDQEKMKKLGQ